MPAFSPVALGMQASDFSLQATTGQFYTLSELSGERGTVVVFICNHCPYVIAIAERMVEDANILAQEGISFVAICSNDAVAYPEDSFTKMKLFAEKYEFSFPYLHDETQEVAQAYDAVCTPDFFGLNADGLVQYRGRLDEARTAPPSAGAKRELVEAMREIAATGRGPTEQFPSVGCGIKWR